MLIAANVHPPFRKLLVANRSEIAIRIFRAAAELGIATVAIYAREDALSLHRFKADEAYLIEAPGGAIGPYLAIDRIIQTALDAGADAIHPGYGFLSENPDLAEACAAAGITFVGPSPATMKCLGDKVSARRLAISVGVPVMPASDPLPDDEDLIKEIARGIGLPLMLKASWGGGGRGMRPVRTEAELIDLVRSGRREAKAAFGKDDVYLEKLVTRARHVEVQLLGDTHGNLFHLFERDCTIQRRHQKVIERAPAPYLSAATRTALCEAALAIGAAANYVGAGTVEFLLDVNDGKFYFIEVNPRIQVEHTVTEAVTGIDIVKAQIHIAAGGRLGVRAETGVPKQEEILLSGHALQCRITTEDPGNNLTPDHGRITAYRSALGHGVRIDGGTAYAGAVVTRHYDPLLEKVTVWAPEPKEAVARMVRALREYRIRGVATNLSFLENVLTHALFQSGEYTTRFIDETPELLHALARRDRASRLLRYIAEVTVNGHPETRDRARPEPQPRTPVPPDFPCASRSGPRQLLLADGPNALARWMRDQTAVLVTDTTMRDAHQSLLATRMRTFDMAAIADAYSAGLPELFSVECWGGATFDVAMRFLNEDPWERLRILRERMPSTLLQMLLRGANGVGYTNYPDNVVRHFIQNAAVSGVDIFRIFDCLNWVENMRVAIDAVVEAGRVAEGALCYTGDITDPARAKYSLRYYVGLARELEKAGCHVLAIKDMAGLLRPAAAEVLVKALRDVTDLPIHFHTHDSSGISAASVLKAVEAGVDAIDGALDAFSGTTSQPCLGSLVEALRHTPRQTGLDPENVRKLSRYWAQVRAHYRAFEVGQASGASEVYVHEMPGGQFTNLREQAHSMGLGDRWAEVAQAYRDANLLFGDIVKVTPSSKVVGDMALMMVAQDLKAADILDSAREIAFPASVVEMMRGDLGQPPGGWPQDIQRRVLGEIVPLTVRPSSLLDPVDLADAAQQASSLFGGPLSEPELSSWLMYPKVYAAFRAAQHTYGPISALPTSVFFYGMSPGQEIDVRIDTGKSLVIKLDAVGVPTAEGLVRVFFELNGQPRTVEVPDRAGAVQKPQRRRADPDDPRQVPSPMAGVVVALRAEPGQVLKAGDVVLSLEAMKMETYIAAPRDGVLAEMSVSAGQTVESKDLLFTIGA